MHCFYIWTCMSEGDVPPTLNYVCMVRRASMWPIDWALLDWLISFLEKGDMYKDGTKSKHIHDYILPYILSSNHHKIIFLFITLWQVCQNIVNSFLEGKKTYSPVTIHLLGDLESNSPGWIVLWQGGRYTLVLPHSRIGRGQTLWTQWKECKQLNLGLRMSSQPASQARHPIGCSTRYRPTLSLFVCLITQEIPSLVFNVTYHTHY